ncbi:unnamed protein product [Camellia sinensis]
MNPNKTMENTGFLNEKLDRLATWVAMGVASAFFSSLERFACVNLTTSESDDDTEDEARDRPFMFSDVQSNADTTTSVDDLPV